MPVREELLQKLVRLEAPLEEITAELRRFDWDCDTPLITLEAASIRSVLERYLSGSLSADDVENWADAIEVRDDIDATNYQEIISDLSNPLITRSLSPTVAAEIIAVLSENRS